MPGDHRSLRGRTKRLVPTPPNYQHTQPAIEVWAVTFDATCGPGDAGRSTSHYHSDGAEEMSRQRRLMYIAFKGAGIVGPRPDQLGDLFQGAKSDYFNCRAEQPGVVESIAAQLLKEII